MIPQYFLVAAALLIPSVVGNPYETTLIGKNTVLGFNCDNKIDDYYRHPSKCFRFIKCVDSVDAFEYECPVNINGVQLFFDTQRQPGVMELCTTPAKACCNCNQTTPATDPPTTTIAPTPAPINECDPHNCKLRGYCQDYWICTSTPEGYKWMPRVCDKDLYWGNDTITGGKCMHYGCLDDKTKEEYLRDPGCIEECGWYQKEADYCSERFNYIEGFTDPAKDRDHALECDQQLNKIYLIWSQIDLTCVECTRVTYPNGTKCPCGNYTLSVDTDVVHPVFNLK